MAEGTYAYIIIGGGVAGASAVKGIRAVDTQGSILLIAGEEYLPYNRPPLTKQLWFGKKRVEDIFANPSEYYPEQRVDTLLVDTAVKLDAAKKSISDSRGHSFHYDKLLLATGGRPRQVDIPGGVLEGVCYYRYLDDYLAIRALAGAGKSAVVVGGGFIGSEIAAALTINELQVTLVFPEDYPGARVFPAGLGQAISRIYRQKGVRLLCNEMPVSFARQGETFLTRTRGGQELRSDILIVGIGITPAVELAEMAGLAVDNGIVVNEYLQSSHPDIFAAGDNANFPYQVLGERTRVEHWDNALNMGACAGRNMAGAGEPYAYMPYFFSDLFEFGYEAIGDVTTRLETFADWQQENDTGVIYYLRDGQVRGAMMCNIFGKVDAARELIQKGAHVNLEELRGAIQ